MRKCRRENCTSNQEAQLHHIIPKSFFAKPEHQSKKYDLYKTKSNRTLLCKKCHDTLHFMLIKVLWNQIPTEKQEKARERIWQYTHWYINKCK